MNSDLSDLVREFREMADDELIVRCSDGSLTEAAQSIAIAELASRGLRLPDAVAPAAEDTDYEGDFETVARFLNPTNAHVVCACLVAAGVPAVVADANLVQTNSLWAIAAGGARILVPARRVAEAKEVIKAFNRGDYRLRDDDEMGN